jgi:hypothetical protein
MAHAGNLFIFAKHEISAPAGLTMETVAAMPSDSNTLTDFPIGSIGPSRIDHAGNLMSRNPRIG